MMVSFRSSEHLEPDQKPKLTITYELPDKPDQILDLTSSEQLTELTVPPNLLEYENTYYVRVKFYDGSLETSEWSETIQFTTTGP